MSKQQQRCRKGSVKMPFNLQFKQKGTDVVSLTVCTSYLHTLPHPHTQTHKSIKMQGGMLRRQSTGNVML